MFSEEYPGFVLYGARHLSVCGHLLALFMRNYRDPTPASLDPPVNGHSAIFPSFVYTFLLAFSVDVIVEPHSCTVLCRS